jgi:hypothetical protein
MSRHDYDYFNENSLKNANIQKEDLELLEYLEDSFELEEARNKRQKNINKQTKKIMKR